MKKVSITVFVIIFISLVNLINAENIADYKTKVKVNGEYLYFPAKNINGRILLPMRKILETLGAKVDWDNTTKTATANKGNKKIKVKINDVNAWVNDKKIVLDVPAKIFNGRTLVPIRFIAESFDCLVYWEEKTKTAIVQTKTISSRTIARDYNSDEAVIFKMKSINEVINLIGPPRLVEEVYSYYFSTKPLKYFTAAFVNNKCVRFDFPDGADKLKKSIKIGMDKSDALNIFKGYVNNSAQEDYYWKYSNRDLIITVKNGMITQYYAHE